MTPSTPSPPQVDVQQLLQEVDLGGRRPLGLARSFLFAVCIAWSLLQLWYASPLPFTLRVFVLNATEMRSLHLGLALLLAYLAYPFGKRSSRTSIPI